MKSETLDENTLRVSWNDVQANYWRTTLIRNICLLWFSLLILTIFFGVSHSSAGIIFLSNILICIIFVPITLWIRWGTRNVKNHVDFSADHVRFKSESYPTSRITRLDYGERSSLTGIKNDNEAALEPVLIRMWINDTDVFVISENHWTFDICHKIHSALNHALQQVQANEKEEVKAVEFGKSGNFGAPDY